MYVQIYVYTQHTNIHHAYIFTYKVMLAFFSFCKQVLESFTNVYNKWYICTSVHSMAYIQYMCVGPQ